jgi:predicted nucleic acid-binding Zn finger protein
MQNEDSAALERAVTEGCIDIEKRDVRALTEYMSTLPLGGSLYSVTTESGAEYIVDLLEGRCTCPDYKYNLPTDDGRERCKHLSRVAYATGERRIPKWVDHKSIDPQLGEHTGSGVRNDSPPPLSRRDLDPTTTALDKLQPDGGTATVSGDSDVCANGSEHCDGPDGDGLPCFECYEVDE